MGISSQSSNSANTTNQIVKMKFLVVISACLAVSSGSILPIGGAYGGAYGGYYPGYAGPLADVAPASAHGLVAHPNGAVTPADTPSDVAARADHLAAKGAIYAAHAPALVAAPAVPAVAPGPVYGGVPAVAAPAPALAPVPAIGYAGYVGPLADALPAGAAGLVAHPNGAVTPADTPSVVAARADHLAARGAAYAAAAPVLAYGAGYGYGVPAVAGPAIAAPAIAAPAIAAPVPAVAPVPAHAFAAGVIPVGAGSPTGALVTFPNGAVVPADEPAVAAARADHLAAKGGLGW